MNIHAYSIIQPPHGGHDDASLYVIAELLTLPRDWSQAAFASWFYIATDRHYD